MESFLRGKPTKGFKEEWNLKPSGIESSGSSSYIKETSACEKQKELINKRMKK